MKAQVLNDLKRLASLYVKSLKEDGYDSEVASEYVDEMVEWVEDNKDSFEVELPSELFTEYSEMLSFYEDDDERADVIDDFEIFVYGNENDDEDDTENDEEDDKEEMTDDREDEDESPLFSEEDVFDRITDSVIDQLDLGESFFDEINYTAFSNLLFHVLEHILDKEPKEETACFFIGHLMIAGYMVEDENVILEMIDTINEKCKAELSALYFAQIAFDGKASPDLVMEKVDAFLEDRD